MQNAFEAAFTPGGFVRASVARKQPKQTVTCGSSKEERLVDGLSHCSNEGCIKVYQTYAGLGNHILYRTDDFKEENATLMDRAKKSAAKTSEHFDECQRSYLDL